MTFMVRQDFDELEYYIHMSLIIKYLNKSVTEYEALFNKLRELPGIDSQDVNKLPDIEVPLTEALDHALHLSRVFSVEKQFEDLIAERRQKWIDEEPERQALIDDGTFVPQKR